MNDDLKNLSDKINAIQSKDRDTESRQKTKDKELKQKDNGFAAGMELVINMLAGGLLGFGIDYYANTKPLFMILFFLIGFGWGMFRVYRIMEKLDKSD